MAQDDFDDRATRLFFLLICIEDTITRDCEHSRPGRLWVSFTASLAAVRPQEARSE
jgi:hypothetical protein